MHSIVTLEAITPAAVVELLASMGFVTEKEIRAVEMQIQNRMKGYQNKVAGYSKVSPHTCTIPQLISLFSILESPTTIAQVSHGIHALIHGDILSNEKCTYNRNFSS